MYSAFERISNVQTGMKINSLILNELVASSSAFGGKKRWDFIQLLKLI